MTVLTEGPRAGEAIIAELENCGSRDAITIGLSQTLLANQVLGRTAFAATVAQAAAAGNTGNGTMTLADPAFAGTVKAGVYKVVIVEPGSNVGTFVVEDPEGTIVGRGAVATAFDGEVKFTLADGGTDFVAGDTFNITVSAITHRWGAYDPTATDGRAVPRAVLYAGVTTGGSVTLPGVAFTRVCQVNAQKLQWLTGLTTDQKTAAIAMLNASAQQIVVRT